MIHRGRLTVGNVGLLCCVKVPQCDRSSTTSDRSPEFLHVFCKTYAFVPRGVVASLSAVVGILQVGGKPQVLVGIIKGVAIAVIALSLVSLSQAKYLPMHEDVIMLSAREMDISFSVKSLRTRRIVGVPLPLVQFIETMRADFGVLSLGKRNLAVQWIRWGCHQMALHGLKVKGAFQRPMSPLYLAGGA